MLCDLVFSAQEFLKILPGLAIFPLTFYLGWKKIGYRVTGSVTSTHQRTSAPRISQIVLVNHKDRPIPVCAVQAVIAGKRTFTIEEFDPPLILKALESITIETTPYSSLDFSDGPWKPPFNSKELEIFLITSGKTVPVAIENHPTIRKLQTFLPYEHGTKSRFKFNGKVYNKDVAYAIAYKEGTERRTAFVDISGFISEDWDYKFNCLPTEALTSKQAVFECLKQAGFTDKFTIYDIVPLQDQFHSAKQE
jgi:hypothetical protein